MRDDEKSGSHFAKRCERCGAVIGELRPSAKVNVRFCSLACYNLAGRRSPAQRAALAMLSPAARAVLVALLERPAKNPRRTLVKLARQRLVTPTGKGHRAVRLSAAGRQVALVPLTGDLGVGTPPRISGWTTFPEQHILPLVIGTEGCDA